MQDVGDDLIHDLLDIIIVNTTEISDLFILIVSQKIVFNCSGFVVKRLANDKIKLNWQIIKTQMAHRIQVINETERSQRGR